jgi:cytochrome c biogenesis protein CcmG/thiol:disulfide interchange protein DsbE
VRRRVLASIALALLAACTSSGGTGKPDDRAVQQATYTRLDGTTTSLATYAGTPTLVNFFASTCPPCVTEMPALEQVKQEAAGKVQFVGIDVGDTVEGTRSFVAGVKVTWDIGRDPRGDIATLLGSVGLPTTAVLDRDGAVVYKHLGPLNVDELRAELRSRGFL